MTRRPEQTGRRLFELIERLPVIDSHEHLPPEAERTGMHVDAFSLFSAYTVGELRQAGMSDEQYRRMRDPALPLVDRWRILEPYWERIRHGSYARAILIAIRRLYGVDDLAERTVAPLSEAMAAANRPGIYDRVLREECGIGRVLTHVDVRQHASSDLGTPLILPVPLFVYEIDSWESIAHPVFAPGSELGTLEEYLDAGRSFMMRMRDGGAPGVKMGSAPFRPPDRRAAQTAFEGVRRGDAIHPLFNPIHDYVVDELIAFAAELGMVVAVHTGYWGDFRERSPLHMIPMIQRHPSARFDIFHLGYPWVREALMLGKGFPNVWLNWCWTHVISQRMATDALREALDALPLNRVVAFGGDYGAASLEKVYGHLTMAREDVCDALAERIDSGRMSEEQAVAVARAWLYDNPRELYRIEPLP